MPPGTPVQIRLVSMCNSSPGRFASVFSAYPSSLAVVATSVSVSNSPPSPRTRPVHHAFDNVHLPRGLRSHHPRRPNSSAPSCQFPRTLKPFVFNSAASGVPGLFTYATASPSQHGVSFLLGAYLPLFEVPPSLGVPGP
ncbi:hypothetical protein K523DRAFT_156605 [Schizophyllum commune Tattone D]|nr:hypothetical protein K523DRAFT_156605 [Schizophyllum commune Tattone D]